MLSSRSTAGLSLTVLLAVTGLVALLRLVHIDADTPRSQWYGSVAIFVDEGYKTLSPRNLVLFGESHWNAEDDYPGWMTKSVFTQWPYYLAFRWFGSDVESARLVTSLFFLLLLGGFTLLLRARYSTGMLLVGAALLGALETLFFFSRVALFEVPIAALAYLPLFFLGRPRPAKKIPALAIIMTCAFIVTLGIKSSALLCFVPMTVGVVLASKLREGGRLGFGRSEIATAAVLAILAVLSWSQWGYRFEISAMAPRSVLLNPLTLSSGLLIAAGLLSISHGLLTQGRRFLADPYRAPLVCLATIGPLMLALFPRSPLRYYVPLLPAYALLVVEWLHLRLWRRPVPAVPSPLRAIASFLLLVWAVFSLGQVIDQRLLLRLDAAAQIPWLRGTGTGLWNSPRFLAAGMLGLLLALAVWRWRRRILDGRNVLAIIVTLVVLEGAQGLLAVGRFLAAPAYEAKRVSSLLEERLPEGASIAGDWAPRFALGTGFKALYMTTDFNHPRRILQTRPEYFVFCDDPDGDGRRVRRLLTEAAGVSLGPPILETSYIGFEVSVYPLRYSPAPAAASVPGSGAGPSLLRP